MCSNLQTMMLLRLNSSCTRGDSSLVTNDCGVVLGVEAGFEWLGDREQRDKRGWGGASLGDDGAGAMIRWFGKQDCVGRGGAGRGGEVGGGGGAALGWGEEGGGI